MATILKRGSKGAAVKELQRLLNLTLVQPIRVDGDFGPATEGAVRVFQALAGLVIDGVYGKQSRTALVQATTPVKPGRIEPDKSAMGQTVIPFRPSANDNAKAPPNVASLQLLNTGRSIDEIFIHCAATPEGKDFTVADIRAWHKARGFSDVGYHYIVYRDGRIMLGRPIGQVGAHASGHNTGTIGIAYIGGVSADGKTAKDTRTPEQRASLLWLTQQLATKHKVNRVRGHNEVAAKACPSFEVAKDALGRIAA